MIDINSKDLTKDIKALIQDFHKTEFYVNMLEGEKYYRGKNSKILSRQKQYWAENGLRNDPYKANHKLASSFLGVLVDQKVQYLLSNGVILKSSMDIEGLKGILGKKFDKKIKQLAKEASKKAVGWLQVYINQKQEFAYLKIPSEQIIPIYNEVEPDILDQVVRYYPIGKENNQILYQAELWDSTHVLYLRSNPKGEYDLYDIKPHFTYNTVYGSVVAESKEGSWGRVPFIPLYNNDERMTDLENVKSLIDIYDIVLSDFSNNLDDIQDVYWLIKNYGGEDLKEFLNDLKKYKAIQVGEEGEVKTEKIEIPTEAREKLLSILNENIYKFGKGVDTSQVGDGNITNVVIKSRYANLDLKANDFETELVDSIETLIEFANIYLSAKGELAYTDVEISFNRSIIINEVELLNANVTQRGNISEKTRLSNHPWVYDADAEIDRMKDEEDPLNIKLDDNTGSGGDEVVNTE